VKQVPLGKTKLKEKSVAALTQLCAEIVLIPEPILKLYQAVTLEVTFEGETKLILSSCIMQLCVLVRDCETHNLCYEG